MSNRTTLTVAILVGCAIGASFAFFIGVFPSRPLTDSPRAGEAVVPSPLRLPEQVAHLQLTSLSRGDVAQCFQFASPLNRGITGPLKRFNEMVRKPPYDIMVRSTSFQVGKSIVRDNHAIVLVTVIDERREVRVFRFVLSKQENGTYRDCWMTDGVFEVSQPRPAPSQPSRNSSRVGTNVNHSWRALGDAPHVFARLEGTASDREGET